MHDTGVEQKHHIVQHAAASSSKHMQPHEAPASPSPLPPPRLEMHALQHPPRVIPHYTFKRKSIPPLHLPTPPARPHHPNTNTHPGQLPSPSIDGASSRTLAAGEPRGRLLDQQGFELRADIHGVELSQSHVRCFARRSRRIRSAQGQ